MYVKRGGRLVKITKKSIGAVSPSLLATKRAAFERKKKTLAFKKWRRYQYLTVQRGCCFYCRRPIRGAWITDHVIPLFRGGTSRYTNLVVCCWACNQRKGIRILGEENLKKHRAARKGKSVAKPLEKRLRHAESRYKPHPERKTVNTAK